MKQNTTISSDWHGLDMAQAMAEHEGLVHWVVHRQWSGGLGYNEVLQLGRIGLWKALQRYDPAQGTAFSTYAAPAIARTIWRGVVEAQADPREVLTPQPPQAAPDLDEQAQAALVRQALYRLVATLPRRVWRAVIVPTMGWTATRRSRWPNWPGRGASPPSASNTCIARRCSGWRIRRTHWRYAACWHATQSPTTGRTRPANGAFAGPGGDAHEHTH